MVDTVVTVQKVVHTVQINGAPAVAVVKQQTVQVVTVGTQGPAGGGSNLTGGAGIVVIGTEIRLSIGTLPQAN
jgi:hypothetical protein